MEKIENVCCVFCGEIIRVGDIENKKCHECNVSFNVTIYKTNDGKIGLLLDKKLSQFKEVM